MSFRAKTPFEKSIVLPVIIIIVVNVRACLRVSLSPPPQRINAVGRLSAAAAAAALDPKSNEEVGRRQVGHTVRGDARFRLITKSHYVLCHIQTQSHPDRPNPSGDV